MVGTGIVIRAGIGAVPGYTVTLTGMSGPFGTGPLTLAEYTTVAPNS